MSTVKCKNCGAAFDADLAYCPYCGTMNKKGAYKDFRSKISGIIDAVLGLKDDVQKSVSAIILSSLLRSVIFIAVILGLAFLLGRASNVNYYNDREEDTKAYEQIVWMDSNIDRLNAAYENEDYQTIKDLYYENTGAVRGWPLYPTYCLKAKYAEIKNDTRKFDEYRLQSMLYMIFYPEYYSGYNSMTRVKDEDYLPLKEGILSDLEDRGYSYEELKDIYGKCSDKGGYLDISALKEYVKEDGNGQL